MEPKKTGDRVTFIDEHRQERPALVTQVWSPNCINLVLVSGDEKRTDQYGRQIEHRTSVIHESAQSSAGDVVGNCWR